VEAGRNSPVVARDIRESRSIRDWTSPLKPPRERKWISMRKIFVLGLLILAGAVAWAILSRREHNPWSLPAVELNRTDPVTLVSPYRQPGVSWRVSLRRDTRLKGSWAPYLQVVTQTEVLEFDPASGSRARMTVESLVPQSGATGRLEREAYERMPGRQFEYRVALDGTVTAAAFPDGKPAVGWDAALFPIIVMQGFHDAPYRKETAVPGDHWVAVSFPFSFGHPDWYLRFDSDVEFAGYQRRGGVEVAVLRERYHGTIGGGIPVSVEEPTPDMRVVAMLHQVEADGLTTYYLDPASGRVLWVEESVTHGAIDMTFRKMVAGRPSKEEKLAGGETREFRSFATVEYLPLAPA